MKTKTPRGSVLILWRLAKAWRDAPGDSRWRKYGAYPEGDAQSFMLTKAPFGNIFEYKIRR